MTALRLLCSAVFLLSAAVVEADPVLTRGPYLQLANPTAITVCWRTSESAAGRIRYGTAPEALTFQTDEAAAAADHSVRLTGLTPATTYYYSVETGGALLASGSSFFFRTPPADGAEESVRFWALGDCGTAGYSVRVVRDAFVPLHAQRRADMVLLLGDNAYYSGNDAEYQAAIFDVFPGFLREVPFWSCIGNHETYSGLATNGKYAYENIFDFPTAGECGGVASGTERYFSWNYGRVHFISLDSMTASRAANGPMAQWLTADLQANLQPWVVALWHHPPYSRGSHNSDTEGLLIEMRQNILPILENHGVDLVLCGHSHTYERSYLLDGHYGSSSTLSHTHKKNSASGREDGTGAYYKTSVGMAPHQGAVYVVAGSSGQAGGGSLNHPAHFVSLNQLGSVVVDVNGSRMDVKFLREMSTPGAQPVIQDYFSIIKGTPPPVPQVTRGPYLQKANPTAMTVRWRTATGTVGGVRIGTALNAMNTFISEPASTTEHSVRLSGLLPGTKYYYSLEGNGYTLAGGADYFFTTPPASGSTSPVRVWVLGDAGTNSDEQRSVRDAFLPLHAVRPADMWLMLGDNAYYDGLDSEYQAAVFEIYDPWLKQVPLWSCIGNHETYGGEVNGRYAYEEIFDFPAAGECGGLPSGTERYYSWDYANIHFVALDSETSSRLTGSPMLTWLAADLAANLLPWTVVCFHHPPYTKGTHDSDYEQEHIEMRENVLPVLEQYGVDLVLCGHSHVYERSFFLKGHYGDSSTFSAAAHVLDGGDGDPNGDGAYKKYAGQPAAQNGTVYVVAGSSGQYGGGELNHPAHFISLAELGSVVLDVSGQQMDVRFLREQSVLGGEPLFDDFFSIRKGQPPPPSVPGPLSALPLSTASAVLHWEDNNPAEQSFDVFISLNGGPFEKRATLPPDTFGWTAEGLTPGGNYQFKVQVTNSVGMAESPLYGWTQTAPAQPLPPVAVWRFLHWGTVSTEGEAGNDANPDNDGLTNLMEYALGTPPRAVLHALGFGITSSPGGAAFHFHRMAAPDLTYWVELSETMTGGSWTTAFSSTGAANVEGQVSVPIGAGPARRFARLRVMVTP